MAKKGIAAALCLFSMYAVWCSVFLDSYTSSKRIPEESVHATTAPPPITNEVYLSINRQPEIFSIDDTEALLKNFSTVPAVPYDFGYTVAEGLEMFPPYEYGPCNSTSASLQGESVNLDYEENEISLTCRGTTRGKYIVGPTANYRFMNPKEVDSHFNLTRASLRSQTILPHHEWAIASCRDNGYKYELHFMKPRLLPEVQSKANATTMLLEEKFNISKPPLSIVMITVDSFSRRHFFRKLTKTVELLNRIEQQGDWKVTDFKLHNIIGTDTAENQSFVFGTGFAGYASRRETRGADLFGESAIWKQLGDRGFVSLLGFEGCAYKMNRVIGRNPKADHVVNPFYCAAEKYSSVTSHKKNAMQQRCLGKHMSHWYLMDYSLKFLETYPTNNHWVYNHFTAAHEITGQHAQTLDDDLVLYLQELMLRSVDRDMVIYIVGDHGMRYGNFISDTKAIQEHRLPVFFMLNKHDFLSKIEHSYDSLAHNAKRLTSKPDLRRSLMFLAENRYGNTLKHSNSMAAINLFTEKAADSRMCEDIGIPAWYCSTYVLEAAPKSTYNASASSDYINDEDKDMRNAFMTAANEALFIINSESYGSHNGKDLCLKLTLKEISLVLYHEDPSRGAVIKLALTVNESPSAKFDAWVLLSSQCMAKMPPMETRNFPPFLLYYQSQKLCGKLINAFRTDAYRGECEKMAREADLNAEFCICREELLDQVGLATAGD